MTTELLAAGLDFGEGPRWHENRLWFSDFYRRVVESIGPDGDRRVEVEIDDQPSGLGWLPDGDLLVVSMKKRQVLRVRDGVATVHADLSGIAVADCNDMVVDARGNAYVGNFGAAGGIADLALVRPDGSVEVAATGIRFPNGSVITPDGRTLIVGESMGRAFTAYAVAEDGTLSDRREWAPLPDIAPDGCTLDAEGAIWVADAVGTDVLRVVEGGEITHRITPSQKPFACALGGPAGRTLFIVTAPGFGEKVSAGKGLGRIETVQVEVPAA